MAGPGWSPPAGNPTVTTLSRRQLLAAAAGD
jgi:hypothetical protein